MCNICVFSDFQIWDLTAALDLYSQRSPNGMNDLSIVIIISGEQWTELVY